MNRRNIIRGLVAVTLVPAVPAVASVEERKREAMRALLSLPDDDWIYTTLVRICMSRDHELRDYAVELFESGIPVNEINHRLCQRL